MKLVIRTQASNTIGLGHFMRCFALAEAARAQGLAVTFVVNADAPVLDRAAAIGARAVTASPPGGDFAVLDAEAAPEDWVIVDTYAADADYLTTLSARTRVAVIDDLDVLDRFDCRVLVNPTPAAPKESYAAKSRAKLLLGPDYALVRAEFRTPLAVAGDGCVTLTFGGSDPTGLTGAVAEQLHAALPGTVIRAIAGPANRHIPELQVLARRLDRLQLIVSPPTMTGALAGSALVVTAAGGSVNELASLGVPALATVVYDNQAAWLDACPFPTIDARAGIPKDFATEVAALMTDPVRRQAIARTAHGIVDGQGVFRILEALR
ncbi:UDP-2,4-diacetamido-2,4,6-trideoxy-beta-L-altropyranose hydrolase [Asticcacaulis solisilvae]|uniref:UDP-2,4-diacetamido-2,4, 6-trideoxy-beta-L-altropyranose hydrolase n=1 Tax=Asticcacaulis solisilvae TaxID=1217274 RepID=UPI003FD6E590